MTKFDIMNASVQTAIRQEQFEAWRDGRYEDLQLDDDGEPSDHCLNALLDYLDTITDKLELAERICGLTNEALCYRAMIKRMIANSKKDGDHE